MSPAHVMNDNRGLLRLVQWRYLECYWLLYIHLDNSGSDLRNLIGPRERESKVLEGEFKC